jgi:hypothetical protein
MDREEARNLGPEDRPNNLLMLGPTGLLDPPRSEAIEAAKERHASRIRVTNDYGRSQDHGRKPPQKCLTLVMGRQR